MENLCLSALKQSKLLFKTYNNQITSTLLYKYLCQICAISNAKTIKNLQDNTSETFDYINEAKRKSRELQIANGGLGCGSLQVKK